MKVEFQNETLADGTEIHRRFENDIFIEESHYRKYPNGHSVILHYNSDKVLTKELHVCCDRMEIFISIDYKNGKAVNETYISKKKLITRKRYEKLREQYPDMPPANQELSDFNNELLQMVKEERKQQKNKTLHHTPNMEEGKKSDEFCLNLIRTENGITAKTFLNNKKATLGEWDRKKSKKFHGSLVAAGCGEIYCCGVTDLNTPEQSCGKLVIQLPIEKANREKVFKIVNKIIQRLGFDPSLDNGQEYCFVMLD